MKRRHRIFTLLMTLACGSFSAAHAQDVHFSQFWEAPVLRNPALVGTSRGDYRATALYRNQWSSISGAFTTALLHAEMRRPVRTSGDNSDYLSFGLAAYADKAGSVNLRTNAAYPAIAYNKLLNAERRSYLSVGFTAGYLQRSYDASKMTFDNQWTGTAYDPSAPARENLSAAKISAFDVGAGLAYTSTFGADGENSFYAGVSAYNITRPKQHFMATDPTVDRKMRLSANAGMGMMLNDMCRLELHGNFTQQGSATEVVAGGLISWQKRPERQDDPVFSAGAGVFYRYADAVVPVVRISYKNLTFTGSYDVTVSTLRAATGMRGGYEAGIIYSGFFFNEKSMRGRTSCPVF